MANPSLFTEPRAEQLVSRKGNGVTDKIRKEFNVFIDKTMIDLADTPPGTDRRAFVMRRATIGAAAVLTGCTAKEKAMQVGGMTPPPANVERRQEVQGAVMTTIEEFYKVGAGPSSSVRSHEHGV